MKNIPLCNPVASKEMEDAVINTLRNDRIILGEEVTKFEEEFAKYCGTKHAISVGSGTCALQFALTVSGVKKNVEVITCTHSFIATANSVLHANGTPVFCDINDSYLIDSSQIEKKITKNTKGILPIHIYGNPADMDEINEIAEKNDLFVIEEE